MPQEPTFRELIAEGDAVPVEGWDFSWFDGRATEERPLWGYARLMGERAHRAAAMLDIQTGGGEVLAAALGDGPAPPLLAATESWQPNAEIARRNLGPFGATVAHVPDDADLPFGSGTFDLVVSRHPVVTAWPEIARVLQPGGSYLSQQIGTASNRELFEFMMGPQPASGSASNSQRAVAAATSAGLEVVDLREATLRVEFFDVAAVVYFLKKVLWTVPGFTVAGYLEPLARMHEQIESEGSFVSHAQRFLIDARKPG